jgi:hypothetical protein
MKQGRKRYTEEQEQMHWNTQMQEKKGKRCAANRKSNTRNMSSKSFKIDYRGMKYRNVMKGCVTLSETFNHELQYVRISSGTQLLVNNRCLILIQLLVFWTLSIVQSLFKNNVSETGFRR